MGLDRWERYIGSLHDGFRKQPAAERIHFLRNYGTFKEFVEAVGAAERVPLLIHAYERYRDVEGASGSGADREFFTAAYGTLIRRLLAARLKPTAAEACLLLAVASPRIADGSSLLRTIELAERAFRGRSYPADLFDAARAFRESLAGSPAKGASRARNTLDVLLWHDVRQPARGCWTSRIQRAIAAMRADEAFGWQWLLRNTEPGAGRLARERWTEEARRRLAVLGEERFLHHIDEWFRFPKDEVVRTTIAGGQILYLLVLHCGMTDHARTLPILDRLPGVRWSQRGRMKKVVEGLARVGRRHDPGA